MRFSWCSFWSLILTTGILLFVMVAGTKPQSKNLLQPATDYLPTCYVMRASRMITLVVVSLSRPSLNTYVLSNVENFLHSIKIIVMRHANFECISFDVLWFWHFIFKSLYLVHLDRREKIFQMMSNEIQWSLMCAVEIQNNVPPWNRNHDSM